MATPKKAAPKKARKDINPYQPTYERPPSQKSGPPDIGRYVSSDSAWMSDPVSRKRERTAKARSPKAPGRITKK